MDEISLRMTYDSEADAAYIYITDPIEPGGVASGSTLNRTLDRAYVNADFDHEGKLLGIEILGVSRLLRAGVVAD